MHEFYMLAEMVDWNIMRMSFKIIIPKIIAEEKKRKRGQAWAETNHPKIMLPLSLKFQKFLVSL
jgi:hypothetical protein